MKKIITLLLTLVLVLSLAACGSAGTSETPAPAEGGETATQESTTVRIGLTGTCYEDIWAPAKEALAKEGIDLQLVQFSNFSLPNEALNNGDIEMNAFQHHAFLENDIANNGYDITPIGDTYIVAMAIYSDKIDDLSQLKDGDKVALPNDATNEGRAIKLLESAGILTCDPDAGACPTLADITDYNVKVDFVEVDANLVYSMLPDVTIAVINGNYALDSGLTVDEALYLENEYTDNRYFCLIAVRSEDADNAVYKRIVEEYQKQATIDVFNSQFAGFFVPAWNITLG